jgi:pimeloyl-ACP methyl ester carboxylesterase
MKEGQIQLEDGRTLAYAIYGKGSKTILYFHGTPSSRLELQLLNSYGTDPDTLLSTADFQLVAIDRPGMGLSTFNKKNSFISVAHDAKQLLDSFSINTCSVLCWSGGGPYALAMASVYPKVVNHVSIICGFTQQFSQEIISQMGMNKWYFRFSKFTPLLVKATMNFFRNKPVTRIPPRWITGLPYVDYKLMNPLDHFRELARVSMKEAARHGAEGPVAEARSYYNPLGFDIGSIKTSVHYWWGTKDMSVIRLHAEEVERKISKAVMHYREGEGHLSLYIKYFKEVIQTIAENFPAEN